MNIVFLDANTLGDFDIESFTQLGNVTLYASTSDNQVYDRVKDVQVIITNKVKINKNTLKDNKSVELVCVAATGTDILDKDFLNSKGITWTNVSGYGANSVAQTTVSLLLYVLMNMPYYDNYVRSGAYSNSNSFTNVERAFYDLSDKTWGIIGLGDIGKQVAKIAQGFNANVLYYSTSGKNNNTEYQQVDLETLLKTSDVVSLHCPLNDDTYQIINKDTLAIMKKNAILINVARGALINEQDLVIALNNNQIKAAGLDVVSVEPIKDDNPLLTINNPAKLVITPHIGWSSIQSRKKLIEGVISNIKEYYNK